MSLVKKVGMVIHPVEDLDAAAAFYADALGLEEKFRDGDRFAAFDAGGVTVALAAGDEAVAESTAISFKVDDVAAATERLQAAGAKLLRGPEEGPHELRAVLADLSGNAFIVYAER